jgi:[ribosomal protein S5]-alanine N-acetyltransferase
MLDSKAILPPLAPGLQNANIRLSHLSVDLVSDRYIDWMNDYEVVRYTESRFYKHTRESIEQYVRSIEADLSTLAWGVFVGSKHIGNIKIGPVNWSHVYADVGLIIGMKELWGHGYGTQSLQLVRDWAFDTAGLHKLTAGFCDGNSASMRVFEKSGFAIEARQSSHYYFEGGYRDRIIMANINPSEVIPPNQNESS